MQTCANCGGGIGKLETPFTWKGQTVCATCIAKLRDSDALGGGVIPYATPVKQRGTWRIWLWTLGGLGLVAVLGFLGLFTLRTAVSIPSPAPVSVQPSPPPAAATQGASNQAGGMPATIPSDQ